MKLMKEVCDLVPRSYEEQCDDFVEKYGTQIVEFLLSSAAPHTICTLLHLCLFEKQALPGQLHLSMNSCYYFGLNVKLESPSKYSEHNTEMLLHSDCKSCRTLAVLSRVHNGPNSTESETSSFLQSVCFHYPSAIPKV